MSEALDKNLKDRSLRIGGVTVGPAERAYVDLPVADLYTHTSLNMPVQVINGKRAGPTLFVSAALHGDELNGVEIIRRLFRLKALKSLRGCLIAVPVVNVHGFLNQSRYLPDRRDLNRSFPGSATGSVAARLAYTFSKEIIEKCNFGIDIHTGAQHRSNLPQIRGNLDDKRTLDLARRFGVPLLINAKVRDGSLRGYAADNGIPTLLYETGEALRFDEVGIRAGLRGITSVMRYLEMLPPRITKTRRVEPLQATSTSWVRAPGSGIVRTTCRLGQRVERDGTLAIISDPFGDVEFEVRSLYSGIVIGKSNLPLAHEGDALFHIARFDSIALAQDTVEEFEERIGSVEPSAIGETK